MNPEESTSVPPPALSISQETADLLSQAEYRLGLRLLQKLREQGWPLLVEGDQVLLAPECNGVLVEDAYAASLVRAIQQLQNTEVEADLQDFLARLRSVEGQDKKQRSAAVRAKIAAGQRKTWQQRKAPEQTRAASVAEQALPQQGGEPSSAGEEGS